MFHTPIHGGRVAILGTSLVQQNHFADHRQIWSWARGWSTWAEVLSGGRLDIAVFHDPSVQPGWEPSGRAGVTRGFGGLNCGVSGQKAHDIERRLDQVLALDFDLILVDAGTNDMMFETKEAIAATRQRIVDCLLEAGKTVILLPILARGTEKWAAGGAERAKANWINRKTIELARCRRGCHVFDWNAHWVDPLSEFGTPKKNFSDDGTHFSIAGGYAVGKALARYLAQFLSPVVPRIVSRDDRFEALLNPLGNLMENPECLVTENLQDFLAAENRTEKLCCSVRYPSMEESRALELSLEEGSAVFHCTDRHFHHNLPAGSWVQAACCVNVGPHQGWREISLTLREDADDALTSVALAPFVLGDGTFAQYPAEGWSGLLKTPPIKLRTSGGLLHMDLKLQVEKGSDPATIRICDLDLRQIYVNR
ncbi:SGNH/GDSL hydrolase family protein [Rhizobium sp. CG5]|uniref:SGNH/GDSL hydrolase family protein n=1 Tax=Rhizobium sp. CG5 TaxID=2726076 RepID=UPI002033B0F9|nr:SGNH/GDSL hydrolase family protein [Rhizobium sp. CG5]MCM2477743.1 SGNH/GDSL hydrolase family protein [Rhizobium sp. CG5]